MKLSMWIISDWLEKYHPITRVSSGTQTISGVRYLSDEVEIKPDYLYIGYADSVVKSGQNQIICVNSTDIITLTAPDIYIIFNEIQQMLEYYNNWETRLLQAIGSDLPLNNILSLVVPVLKSSVAITDITHKPLGDSLISSSGEHILVNGYLTVDELALVNSQLQKTIRRHTPYVIRASKTADIIRNFYSKEGHLIGWFIAINGGREDQLMSRLQLAEVFCSFMDLWFRIHVGSSLQSNLFLDILEGRETQSESIRMRLNGLNWGDSPNMIFAVFEPCAEHALGATVINQYVENNFSFVLGFSYGEKAVAVINLDQTEWDDFLSYLLPLLRAQNSRCGFSYPFRDPLSLMMHYQQAVCALAFGGSEAGSVHFCKDFALEYMRERFRNAMDIEMSSPLPAQLKQYDARHGTDYYETLRVYLFCERDQTLAAKKLHIHRNTMVYRINRLKDFIDGDLDDEVLRFHLMLSYFAAE